MSNLPAKSSDSRRVLALRPLGLIQPRGLNFFAPRQAAAELHEKPAQPVPPMLRTLVPPWESRAENSAVNRPHADRFWRLPLIPLPNANQPGIFHPGFC